MLPHSCDFLSVIEEDAPQQLFESELRHNSPLHRAIVPAPDGHSQRRALSIPDLEDRMRNLFGLHSVSHRIVEPMRK
jgi:hypothetical protein